MKKKPARERNCPEGMERCGICGQPYFTLRKIKGLDSGFSGIKGCRDCKGKIEGKEG